MFRNLSWRWLALVPLAQATLRHANIFNITVVMMISLHMAPNREKTRALLFRHIPNTAQFHPHATKTLMVCPEVGFKVKNQVGICVSRPSK